ncbi:ead/Ea22-like family protein [Salmonella enterica]|uniref:ead/Ea22-like family protein n=1 Tax=Salmonella enterica TaxID=28901 RepID=UPI0018D0FF21|nr:ead/Ea22-like family protein [Salmonella enterica]MBH0545354.1 ead/Ea22-like family protein [Salmonella enterica]MBH0558416.1 ead/Ea22-like family protein [Salmonella enterica]MBH0589710.1 ead/Ea22-like family protein [Salmonella enterica]MBH0617198.1 ead/Ea22-like family protein [Salmonella enterica]MBH0634694.1 ead/Ea22-like family protein [Salmonella enterica]
MTDIKELAHTLRQAAEDELMCRAASDTSDLWMDEASPENVLALLGALAAETERADEREATAKLYRLAVDAGEKRIAELDKRLIEYAGIATREARRVAELKARTVNLPAACADDEYFIDGVFQTLRYERDIERAIIAAGIKVKE